MNAVIAIGTVVLALVLCNLTEKRSNTNSNANSAQSGNVSENANAEARPPESSDRPAVREIDQSAPPPASKNSNAAMPRAAEAAPPLRNLNANQNTPPSPPRAPISGGVMNGKATSLPKPAYPAIARAAHASGTVNVQVVVDENGNVISAVPVSGHPLLRASAAAAARQAKFTPTKLSGQPVKVTGVIVYNFAMQ
jgi:TonB family protein